MNIQSKIVVFDLDETLGYFTEFGMLWDSIKLYIKQINVNIQMDQQVFNKMLHLYPEFIRPNILTILAYLKKQKKSRNCNEVIIYTNNQGPREWSLMIKNFFEDKLSYKLFDQIIAAFKINGKQVELCRTTHLKTHKDLIRCVKIPKETQICFLDDTFYPDMSNSNVYYINIKPYIHDLPFDNLIERFINSSIITKEWGDPTQIKNALLSYLKGFSYTYIDKTKREFVIDKVISKKILQHLHMFFGKYNHPHTKSNKTKHNRLVKNKTLKNKKDIVTNPNALEL